MTPRLPENPPRRHCARAEGGFTLIELMITVAIVAILAAVAYPSYQEQVRKSRRAAAQATMLDVAQKQNQLLLDARRFQAAADHAAILAAPLRVAIPSGVGIHYALSVAATNAAGASPTFTITAVPQGGQASDSCATLTLDHLGVKTPATGCW